MGLSFEGRPSSGARPGPAPFRLRRLRRFAPVFVLSALFAAPAARAGSGTLGADGNLDLTANVRFPITASGLTELRKRFTDASRLLWDATEGQLRLRQVRLTCSPVGEDLADYWIFSGPLRSSSCLDCLRRVGGHVTQSFLEDGLVYAHELGHYALSLGDEYEEDATACGGKGPCISESPPEHSDVDQCLMQEIWGRDGSEFCVRANHDPLRGDNVSCKVNPPSPDGAPCPGNCAAWNTGTLRYESSLQSVVNAGESCWQTLARKFPFLRAPAGRPQAAPPPGFVPPAFLDQCRAADAVTLLLDTSTSMELGVSATRKEICGNKRDDDGDGKTDETDDCAESRIEFVKAAARSFVELGSVLPFRVNLVTFDSSVREHVAFSDVVPALPRLRDALDRLTPGGLTAIGWGLDYSRALMAGAALSGSKSIFLISDGDNSTGPDPASILPDLRRDGIRILAIGTGDAANSRALRDLSSATRGTMLDAADPKALVTAAAEQWARHANLGLVVPARPYAVDRAPREGEPPAPPRLTVPIPIEAGTERFVALLAGGLDAMAGFGVRATLRSPSGALYDSAAPRRGLAVTEDRYFTLLSLEAPEAGTWQLEIEGKATAAPRQTGRLLVIADHPEVDLFADLDRTVLRDPFDTAELTLSPYYLTGLRDVDWEVRLRRPDGSVSPLAVTPAPESPFVYKATVSGFPYAGRYDLEITLRTKTGSTLYPGESRPGTSPPNARAVPLLERHLRLSLYRPGTDGYCPDQRDCEGDGVAGESRDADADHDGIPDAWDADSDNDERQDGGR